MSRSTIVHSVPICLKRVCNGLWADQVAFTRVWMRIMLEYDSLVKWSVYGGYTTRV